MVFLILNKFRNFRLVLVLFDGIREIGYLLFLLNFIDKIWDFWRLDNLIGEIGNFGFSFREFRNLWYLIGEIRNLRL